MVLPLGKAVILIGREGDSNLYLDDSGISKNHASIIHSKGDYILKDNGSANGSFVNGEKIAERPLAHGDTIQFGPYEFRVDLESPMPASSLADTPVELSRGGNSYTRDVVLPEVAGMEKTGPIHVLMSDVLGGLPDPLPPAGFLAKLSPKDRQALALRGERRRAAAGATIIREGESSGSLALLLSGKWEARKGASNVVVGTIGAGEWVGEVNVFDPAGAICSVVAAVDSEYWEITRDAFEKFINDSRSAGSTLLVSLAATLGARVRQTSAAAAQAMEAAALARKKRFSKAVPVFGGIAILAILAAVGTYFLGDAERDRLVSEANQISIDKNETIEEVRNRAHSLRASLDAATAELAQARAENQTLAKNLAALRGALDSARSAAATAAQKPAATNPARPAAPLPPSPVGDAAAASDPGLPGWPSKVVVTKKSIVPLLVSGKVAGSVTLPEGRELSVTGTDGANVVVEFGAGEHRIPRANTNFNEALAAEADARANAPQSPTEPEEPAFANQPAPPARTAPAETGEAPPGASTFEDLTEIVDDVKLVETLDEIKTLAAASKSDSSRFLRIHNAKWKRASKEAARLIALPQTSPAHQSWLKKILEASALCEAERIQLFEAKLKEIDRDWLAMKTDQTVQSIMEKGGKSRSRD